MLGVHFKDASRIIIVNRHVHWTVIGEIVHHDVSNCDWLDDVDCDMSCFDWMNGNACLNPIYMSKRERERRRD